MDGAGKLWTTGRLYYIFHAVLSRPVSFALGFFTYFVLLYPAISPSPDRCGFLLVILLVISLPFYTSDYDNCRCCVVAKVVASLSLDQRPNP